MDGRLITLKRGDQCATCGTPIGSGRQAWWDHHKRTVTCVRCADDLRLTDSTAGASAEREFERRRLKDDYRADVDPDRQSTRSWDRGARGERALAELLDGLRPNGVVVLHDQRIPKSRTNIDHIAIAPSGIFVIDAKYYKGHVELRNKGGWLFRDHRLYVNGRDRTKLLENCPRQIAAVADAIRDVHLAISPLPILCFLDSTWTPFARGFKLNGVRILPPGAVRNALLEPGPLTSEQVKAAGRAIRYHLRPA